MKLKADKRYLLVPVRKDGDAKDILITTSKNRIPLKISLPSSTDEIDFYASIPSCLLGEGEVEVAGPLTPAFMANLHTSEQKYTPCRESQYKIHFSAHLGWINDPNGLIYKDGLYHLYFQYNPFSTRWNNMSWGHAVSRDLLRWQERDVAMLPDEDGAIFSGSAIEKDGAIHYFYTRASRLEEKEEKNRYFTQRHAISTDGGDRLEKTGDVVPYIYPDSRDPKVFWDERTGSYVMVLWLREDEFGFLRSDDLESWTLTGTTRLPGGWECPDLFRFKENDILFSADGTYESGIFDGKNFTSSGKGGRLYQSELYYAAQSWSGVGDKVLLIAWMRTRTQGLSTGIMSVPRLLQQDGDKLLSSFAPELYANLVESDVFDSTKANLIRLYDGRLEVDGHIIEMRNTQLFVDGEKLGEGKAGYADLLIDWNIVEFASSSRDVFFALELDRKVEELDIKGRFSIYSIKEE